MLAMLYAYPVSETTTTKGTHVNTTHEFGNADIADRDHYCTVTTDFRIAGVGHKRFTLGFSPDGRPARKEYAGPFHTELFGWLTPHPTVVDAHPMTPRPVVEVAVGDTIVVGDYGVFVVRPGDRDHAATLEGVASRDAAPRA